MGRESSDSVGREDLNSVEGGGPDSLRRGRSSRPDALRGVIIWFDTLGGIGGMLEREVELTMKRWCSNSRQDNSILIQSTQYDPKAVGG
jgi:hypothetical protein